MADAHSPGEPLRHAAGEPFDGSRLPVNLLEAVRRARRLHGRHAPILRNHDGSSVTYNQLLDAAYALGARLERMAAPGEVVGVMLPTNSAAIVCLLAAQAAGCTPAMLNFSAGEQTLRAACELARISVVLTSARFLDEAGLARMRLGEAQLVPLEDLRKSVSWLEKGLAFVSSRTPFKTGASAGPNDVAVILFTSGTTGAPKAVALSHANVIANVEQCRLHTAFDPRWVFFNTLPVFHALGLTGGTLLPLLTGHQVVLYPSPLHHERIPKLIHETGANVLVSTDTFANAYARAARAGELDGLDYAVLGGERVREETRAAYAASGVAVLEGYGATECAPVIAVNQPQANRPGSVGRLLPGIEAKLEDVPGVRGGGRLHVRGPNVMLGYLGADGAIAAPHDGWFDTGDLASIDEDGFVEILGRLKRYARIGAEMISLDAVEAHARALWPDARHAALVTRGERGGEEIVLVTDQQDARVDTLRTWANTQGVRLLETPKRILVTVTVPTLAMGKIDYEAARLFANGAAS